MKIEYQKKFKTQYNKLPSKVQKKFKKRIALFTINPRARELNIHPLKGDFEGYFSMNITGDFRALFQTDGKYCYFAYIGTHSELY